MYESTTNDDTGADSVDSDAAGQTNGSYYFEVAGPTMSEIQALIDALMAAKAALQSANTAKANAQAFALSQSQAVAIARAQA